MALTCRKMVFWVTVIDVLKVNKLVGFNCYLQNMKRYLVVPDVKSSLHFLFGPKRETERKV